MHEHRRKRLIALLEDRYENDRKKFCDESNLSESRLGQLLSPTYRGGQGFGEKAACSGQVIPDTALSFCSATAGASPSLN